MCSDFFSLVSVPFANMEEAELMTYTAASPQATWTANLLMAWCYVTVPARSTLYQTSYVYTSVICKINNLYF